MKLYTFELDCTQWETLVMTVIAENKEQAIELAKENIKNDEFNTQHEEYIKDLNSYTENIEGFITIEEKDLSIGVKHNYLFGI